jgi:cell division septation protein DedD
LAGSLAVTGCEEGGGGLFAARDAGGSDEAAAATGETRLVERDVEAPEVFQETAEGLWDGRPSLGGVWVAFPDVTDPERVIIRNEANGKFVIGALFRRERQNPGPPFQISSDAAAALDMLAGAPATLNVTALRRQEVPIASEGTARLEDPEDIETTALDAPETDEGTAIAGEAAAAIASVETTAEAEASPAQSPAPAPASRLSNPHIQIGLFSVEENANRTGRNLRTEGIVPIVQKLTASGKDYWRVIVGPASTSAERAELLAKVKELGFTDAYFTTN